LVAAAQLVAQLHQEAAEHVGSGAVASITPEIIPLGMCDELRVTRR
jgi:hypothetical protein